MVKFANRGKGKPSKRKTLKTKYKIERKVKQHRKKLRKHARKLGDKGIKPQKSTKTNTLPNSFPLKPKILQQFIHQHHPQPHTPTQHLIPNQWGLIALENNPRYLPKDKDQLTKKYITVQTKIWQYANIIIETVDARNIDICRSEAISQQCVKRNIRHIVVICKIDTVSEKYLQESKAKLKDRCCQFGTFTTDVKRKNGLLEEILLIIKAQMVSENRIIIVGKANTGKHTLIKHFMKYAKFHHVDYSTINDIPICDNINIIDTPFRIQDETAYPLFHVPSPIGQQSLAVQEQRVIRYLCIDCLKNRNEFLMHYGIQEFISIQDMLKKIGKVNRVFGKGGMVDIGAVRSSLLGDWYSGRLNYIFQ